MSDIFGGTGLMPAPTPPGAQPNALHGGFGNMLWRLMQQQRPQQPGLGIAPHAGAFGANMSDPGFGGPAEGMYANFLAPGSFEGRQGAMPWRF